jgi:hypothetical protein
MECHVILAMTFDHQIETTVQERIGIVKVELRRDI